ncbi:hypothetical protein BO71DRAFT_397661, partial [Aspergillus ellipticus CBS 707.79]
MSRSRKLHKRDLTTHRLHSSQSRCELGGISYFLSGAVALFYSVPGCTTYVWLETQSGPRGPSSQVRQGKANECKCSRRSACSHHSID